MSIVAIFETLAINLGSAYVNNYNTFGRSFQVRAQADQEFRLCEEDISALCVCSATGLCSLWARLFQLSIQQVQRYIQRVSLPVQGSAAAGVSTGEALVVIEGPAAAMITPGVEFEWMEMTPQERNQGHTATYIFGFSILFACLFIVALYESWVLPVAIVLAAPLALLQYLRV